MAAYEVLLLNTAIPQIQAAQSGDTYVVPRDIAFSTVAGFAAGSSSAPAIMATGDTNTGLFFPAADTVAITTGGSERTRIDSSGTFILRQSSNAANTSVSFNTTVQNALTLDSIGNVGVGATPSAWGSGQLAVQVRNSALMSFDVNGSTLAYNTFHNGTNWRYINAVAASLYTQTAGQHQWWRSTATPVIGNDPVFSQAMTLDASGNLLVGGTSAAFPAAGRGDIEINGSSSALLGLTIGGAQRGFLLHGGTDLTLRNEISGALVFSTNATERARITSGGDFGIGTNTINRKFVVGGAAGTSIIAVQDNNSGYATTDGLQIQLAATGDGYLWNYENAAWIFGTNNTERARITSGGYFKASNDGTYFGSTGTYHELRNTGNSEILYGTNTNANPFGVTLNYTAAAPNGTGNSFLQCVDNVATRAVIRSNGGLANYQANDVNLSDQRTKKDIVAAPSYWDKIKGIEIVHFKYKDQTHDDNNVGVIAQQVEQVAPEFVDQDGWGETPEDGVPLKSIYTSDMYHAAIKALQEAMARIEQLEAEMAALKGA